MKLRYKKMVSWILLCVCTVVASHVENDALMEDISDAVAELFDSSRETPPEELIDFVRTLFDN